MYKKALVEKQIRDGAQLIEELDRRGFGVTAAFWYDVPDSPRWKLVIAARIVDREGPLEATGLLNQARHERRLLDSFDDSFALWSPSSAHFKGVLESVATRNLVESGYRSKGGDSGLVLDNAYVYRLEAPVHT
jgi:hypothetical protein